MNEARIQAKIARLRRIGAVRVKPLLRAVTYGEVPPRWQVRSAEMVVEKIEDLERELAAVRAAPAP